MTAKRMLSFFFVLVLIITAGEVAANAANSDVYTDENGIRYIYALYDDNGTTKVIIGDCRYNKEEEFTLVIPSKIGGYPVAAIAEEAFAEHILFTKVKLPDTLEYIGTSAFRNTLLTSVHIPKNVSYIGTGAFGAHNLDFEGYSVATENKYFKAVDGVLFSKDGKVIYCYPDGKTDKAYAIPKGVECVFDYAFSSAENLKKVTFPDSLIEIGKYAFGGTGLESVHIGKNIQYIGEEAFAFSKNLKVTIDKDALPYIGEDAFNWTAIESDEYGGMYIGHILYSLYNPYADTKIVKIKEGTTAICEGAISHIGGEAVLELPSTIVHIPSDAFRHACVKKFSVHKDNPYYTSVDGALYTKDKKTLLVFPYQEYETYRLADTTEAIYTFAFADAKIKHIIVPENIKVIYDKAFVGSYAEKITFLGEPQYVGYKAFSEYYLEEIVLPENSVAFGIDDFYDTRWYENQRGYAYIGNVLLGYKGNFTISVMDLPDRFTSIGRYAFRSMASVSEVRLPENLKAIGDFAFANCYNLKEITIPATVDEIGTGAFGFNITRDTDTGEVTDFKKVEDFVIKGYTNSIAESYADANGFEFVSIGYLKPESTLLGDIDCDQRLTIKDATALQKYVAGMVGLNTQDKINADFNLDGKVNVRDATAIQKKLAGLI